MEESRSGNSVLSTSSVFKVHDNSDMCQTLLKSTSVFHYTYTKISINKTRKLYQCFSSKKCIQIFKNAKAALSAICSVTKLISH